MSAVQRNHGLKRKKLSKTVEGLRQTPGCGEERIAIKGQKEPTGSSPGRSSGELKKKVKMITAPKQGDIVMLFYTLS